MAISASLIVSRVGCDQGSLDGTSPCPTTASRPVSQGLAAVPVMAHERMMRKFGLMAAALAAAAATVAAALTLQSGCGYAVGAAPCTHVLFIGNSYTSVNDLP